MQLTLLVAYTNQADENKLSNLVTETEGYAILDSGCSTTVAGVNWYMQYFNSLTPHEQSLVVETDSSRNFTFGNGRTYHSMKQVNLPCYIGGMKATIKVDIVKCDIPLLLSKDAMKRGKMVINFMNDSVTIGGKVIKLTETSSGHYKLPLKQ